MMERERLGWILVVAFLAAGVAAYFLLGSKPNPRLKEIKEDVQSNIHEGMPRSEVESFYFSGIDETGNPNMTRSEIGMVRGKTHRYGFRSDIQLVFRFDEFQKLKEYSVQEVITGP